jgi:hypothetical protein
MKKFKPFVFLFATLIALSSCKKGQASFIIKGNVSDETFQTSLTNATIQLYRIAAGTNEETLISELESTDGSFRFEVKRDKTTQYKIAVTKQNYFPIVKEIPFNSLSIEQENTVSLSTTAQSWVKLRFNNLNALSSDHLKYIKQNGKVNCDECCPATEQHLYGPQNTSFICPNDANTTYSIFYAVLNTTDQGIKSVITPAFDTTELLITY